MALGFNSEILNEDEELDYPRDQNGNYIIPDGEYYNEDNHIEAYLENCFYEFHESQRSDIDESDEDYFCPF